jgi:hypothetical protein
MSRLGNSELVKSGACSRKCTDPQAGAANHMRHAIAEGTTAVDACIDAAALVCPGNGPVFQCRNGAWYRLHKSNHQPLEPCPADKSGAWFLGPDGLQRGRQARTERRALSRSKLSSVAQPFRSSGLSYQPGRLHGCLGPARPITAAATGEPACAPYRGELKTIEIPVLVPPIAPDANRPIRSPGVLGWKNAGGAAP